MSYSSEVLADAPRGYWRLGASPTVDSSGNGYTLTVSGSPVTNAMPLIVEDTDPSVQFIDPQVAGSTNFYTLAAGAGAADDFNYTGTASFTAELWFRMVYSDTDFVRLLSHESATDGWLLYAQITDGIGFGRLRSGAFQLQHLVPAPRYNTTYHLVGKYDGTQLRLFLNGLEAMPALADTTAIVSFSANLRIARASPGGDNFAGWIDEVAVYDGLLSDARILAHYQAGISWSTPNYSSGLVPADARFETRRRIGPY